MINISRGTKTFSDSKQNEIQKSSNTNNLSPEEQKKLLGDKSLGDYLNKVADPNWVDTSKTRGVGSNEMGKDAFLKLLLAQLKNQNPGKPMESHEMAAQLAQFSSLESLQSIDQGITGLKNERDTKSEYSSLDLIGKSVSGDSGKIFRTSFDKMHEISYNLPADAREVNVAIKDRLGQVVRELKFMEVAKGKNEFSWNGMTEEGRTMPAGSYEVEVSAVDDGGRRILAETGFEGVISGVNFTAEGPVLLVGNQSVRLKDIKKIVDPKMAEAGNDKAVGLQGDKVGAKAGKDVQTAKYEEAEILPNNLDSIPMDQGLINKLEKEVQ